MSKTKAETARNIHTAWIRVGAVLRGCPSVSNGFLPVDPGQPRSAAPTWLAKKVSLKRLSIKHRTQHQLIDDHVLVRNVSQLVIARIMHNRRDPREIEILRNCIPAKRLVFHRQIQSASSLVEAANDNRVFIRKE